MESVILNGSRGQNIDVEIFIAHIDDAFHIVITLYLTCRGFSISSTLSMIALKYFYI